MPRKSRRVKAFQSKRRQERRSHQTADTRQPAATPPPKPAVPSDAPAPPAGAPKTKSTPSTGRYPFVAAELKRIGILAGIMLVILIVLVLVLS